MLSKGFAKSKVTSPFRVPIMEFYLNQRCDVNGKQKINKTKYKILNLVLNLVQTIDFDSLKKKW